MELKENVSLKPYNTFGIDVKAERFVAVSSVDELRKVLATEKPSLVLGGGSNMLLTQDVKGLVLHINLKGIETIKEDAEHSFVKAAAGEVWHSFVLWCIDKGFGGIENMSLIPGNVGTAPIQNIGAYGVELKDTFVELEAMDIASGEITTFSHADCQFGYRNSVFKNELKGKYIIISVTFKLSKKHNLNTSYGAIETELERLGLDKSIKNISQAVINIRNSKLPNPKEIGNSGSFFKNPVIPTPQFEALKANHPTIVGYPAGEGHTKVAAGWLIENDGWKGKRFGDAGVHNKQALVLVNYGTAQGQEIAELSKKIQDSVYQRFGIKLEAEVNIL